jgi:peptidoglycan/LPS O-acetylase OafA/YrhL
MGVTMTVTSSVERPETRKRRTFRRDIEGLRAVAILGVVLYHAHVGALPGGYVGVDVFFVISGFLITDLLWRELTGTGRLSFAGFYGRRMRRLLPASFLVLAATAIASYFIMSPLAARSALKDGLACAFYVGNYHFALAQTNYLSSTAPSPFQQYWSLGVEEQFYLLWPGLLLLASLVWHRAKPSRTTAFAALAVLGAVSFGLSLWLTNASQPWAFFSLPSRAWELAFGGMVALAAPQLSKLPGRPLLGWLGLGLIAWSMVEFTATTAFPGIAALAPVAGAAAVIAAGCGQPRRGPIDLLGLGPFQVTGRMSYSWYLWHWPFLILFPIALGHPLSLAQNLGVAAMSALVAALTFVVVERPLRGSRWLSALPRRSLAMGGAITVLAAAACGLSLIALPSVAGHGLAPLASAATRGVSAGGSDSSPSADPYLARLFEESALVQQQVTRSLDFSDVPANLSPTLDDASGDYPAVYTDGCMDTYTDASLRPCTFGDTTSSTTIVLTGDSHAGMWFPAIDSAAIANKWRLIVWTKAACPAYDLPIFSPVLGRTWPECDQWRLNVLRQVARIHPLLVIVAAAHVYTSIYNFVPYDRVWLNGMEREVEGLRHAGAQVLVMGPMPQSPVDVPGCLSSHLSDAEACTFSAQAGINASGMAAEQSVVQRAGGHYIDVQPWFCTPKTCDVMVDNLLIYRDNQHLTDTYSMFLSPEIDALLQDTVARPLPAPIGSPNEP